MNENNSNANSLSSYAMGVGLGILLLFRETLKAVAWMALTASKLLETRARANDVRSVSLGDQTHNGLSDRNVIATGLILSQSDSLGLGPADRIIPIPLDPPVAALHLRVYSVQKKVKVEMIVSEAKLRALMQARHHSLAELDFNPSDSIEPLINRAVELAQERVRAVGQTQSLSRKSELAKRRDATPKSSSQATDKASPQANQATVTKAAVIATPPIQRPPAKGEIYTGSPTRPTTYVGQLTQFGSQTVTPAGKPAYEIFEAVIRTDSGIDVPLRGAELERELERNKVHVGDRIEVTSQGKIPVTLPNGTEGKKNLYKVVPLQ